VVAAVFTVVMVKVLWYYHSGITILWWSWEKTRGNYHCSGNAVVDVMLPLLTVFQ